MKHLCTDRTKNAARGSILITAAGWWHCCVAFPYAFFFFLTSLSAELRMLALKPCIDGDLNTSRKTATTTTTTTTTTTNTRIPNKEINKHLTANIIVMCTSRWLRSRSRSAAMLFFTCCRAVRSFLRELEVTSKTRKIRLWAYRKTLLYPMSHNLNRSYSLLIRMSFILF